VGKDETLWKRMDMKEHWIEILKQWICYNLGHRQGETWEYKGLHATCLRCRHTYTPLTDNKDNRFISWLKNSLIQKANQD